MTSRLLLLIRQSFKLQEDITNQQYHWREMEFTIDQKLPLINLMQSILRTFSFQF